LEGKLWDFLKADGQLYQLVFASASLISMPGCCEARSASARNITKACRKHELIRGWSLSETSIIRGWECFLQIFCISRRLRLQLSIVCYVTLSDPEPPHFKQLAEILRHPFRIPTSNSQVVTNRDQKSISTFLIFTRNAAAFSRILLTIMFGFGACSHSHRPVDSLQFEPSVPAERTGSISKFSRRTRMASRSQGCRFTHGKSPYLDNSLPNAFVPWISLSHLGSCLFWCLTKPDIALSAILLIASSAVY
jgi:hypothetical protein